MGFAHEWPGSYVRMRSWTVWQNSEEALIITSNKKNDIIPYLTDGEHPVELLTPTDCQGSSQCWTF